MREPEAMLRRARWVRVIDSVTQQPDAALEAAVADPRADQWRRGLVTWEVASALMDDRKPTSAGKTEIETDDGSSRLGQGSGASDPDQAGNDAAASDVEEGQQEVPEEQTAEADAEAEELAAEIKRLTDLYEQEHDSHLRAVAELQNFKRRASREQAERLQFANQQLLRQLLAVVDNLERALAHQDEGASYQEFAQGVQLVLAELQRVLQAFGVERIEAQETFDPEIHEAVAHAETDEVAEGTILQVDAPGYRLHDRCLRPARVVVAKRPSEQS